jgi:DEAD/DEAH box helicase domain-containing protein
MFKKIRFHTHENIGAGPIHLPEQTLHTTAYWVTFEHPEVVREELEAGLQGLAHALRHVSSLRLMCDPRDLGSVAEVRSATTRLPTVTVYEVYPGGVGYAARLYELHEQLLAEAAELISDCPCEAGCPSCVGPVPGAKSACLQLLSESVFVA